MKTVLCYGDSNTYGSRGIDFDILETSFIASHYRYPKEKRWTGILQKELGNDYTIIEEGLNGRTTVWDDPIEGAYKNGLTYLTPCLESHAPIDMVVLMLGTNDLKTKFSVSASDIAQSIGVLVNTIQQSSVGPDGTKPKVLILCPPPLGKLSYLEGLFGEAGLKKSQQLAKNYSKIAKLYGCHFIDTGKIIKTCLIDGTHYEPKELEKLGKSVAKKVAETFG